MNTANSTAATATDSIAADRAPSRITLRGTSTFDWLFVVLGGLPFYLPLLFILGEHGLARTEPIYWYVWINAIVSSPHVYSTYVRLSRKISERRISWWMGLPLYLTCVGLLAIATEAGYFLQAMTAVNLWQSLHYCRQIYGVSRLVGRNGADDRATRELSFYAYHLAMPLFILGRWDVLYTVWQGKASTSIIPVDQNDWLMTASWAVAGIGGVLGLVGEARTFRRIEHYNPARLVTLMVYYAIHIVGFLSVTFYQRGFFAVTVFHAVQYLAIVWSTERSRSQGHRHRLFNALPQFVAFPAFWAVLFAVGYTLDNHASMAGNHLWPMMASVVLGALSAHHYAVDTVMWRRSAGS